MSEIVVTEEHSLGDGPMRISTFERLRLVDSVTTTKVVVIATYET
jgi:hypothetical protein